MKKLRVGLKFIDPYGNIIQITEITVDSVWYRDITKPNSFERRLRIGPFALLREEINLNKSELSMATYERLGGFYEKIQ